VLPSNSISNPESAAMNKEDTLNSSQLSNVSVMPPTVGDPADESQAAMINAKIQQMIAATNALKPSGSDKLLQGPFVSVKKRRIQENKAIVKVRAAIGDRLNLRSVRKRYESVKDDHLLDSTLNELHDEEDLLNYISAMDIRLNEGKLLSS
jgi:hypothetical protein